MKASLMLYLGIFGLWVAVLIGLVGMAAENDEMMVTCYEKGVR